jgi:5-aminopentanamidase
LAKIYLAQVEPVLHDKSSNLFKIQRCIQNASKENVDLVLFPELVLTGYYTREKTNELAEDKNGKSVQQIAGWAKEYDVKVIFGFPEKRESQIFNSACFINNDGSILGTYQKIHLWDEEYKYFSAGNDFPVWETDIGKIGIMICYDTEFPETARMLAEKGAEIILAPTANMSPLEHSQKIYIQSRACENQLFVATTNRIGIEESTHFFGQSAAADPFGKLLTLADNSESGHVVQVDLNTIQEARESFNYLKDRKIHLTRSNS